MKYPKTKPRGIALAAFKAGNHRMLADKLGVTRQAVSLWIKQGWAPYHRSVEIEAVTGVPRRDLVNPRIRELVQ